ncbi:MAG: hypothetical protein P4L40_08000, partial [Terracidiphilus sp.]|nr:hypothetical protein [Terracidiphilus sp.]
SKVEDIMRAQALPRRGHETVKLGLIGLANTGIAAKHRLAAARSTIAQRAAVTPPVQVVADLDEDTIAEDGSSHVLEAD